MFDAATCKALLQVLHQVDDIGTVGFVGAFRVGLRNDVFASTPLALDQLEQSSGVNVLELLRVERLRSELRDRALELANVAISGFARVVRADLRHVAQLVREAQRLRPQDSRAGDDRDQVFLPAHHERRDAGAPAVLHHVCEQSISLDRAFAGNQVVTALEVHRVDVLKWDESPKIDLLRELRRECSELLIRDDNETIFLDLVSAHDVVHLERALVLRTAVTSPQRGSVRREHPKRDSPRALRCHEAHGQAHETEGEVAGPETTYRRRIALGSDLVGLSGAFSARHGTSPWVFLSLSNAGLRAGLPRGPRADRPFAVSGARPRAWVSCRVASRR